MRFLTRMQGPCPYCGNRLLTTDSELRRHVLRCKGKTPPKIPTHDPRQRDKRGHK